MASLSTQKLHEEEDDKVTETTWQVITSCRWTLSYIGFICCILIYALRVNMSVAIVCMVKPANISKPQKPIPQECQASEISGDIEWDKSLQGWVLSSLFYGYMLTQLLGGYLAGRFGGKRVMLVGLTIYGLVTVLTPFAARYNGKDYTTSAGIVIALRVLAGLSTGVVFPSMQNLFGHWAPPYERSKLSVFCFSGTMVGTVLMLGVGGFFCEWESFDGGWPSMFYVGGGTCLLFCLVWYFFVFDSPEEHPRISNREKLYIAQSFDGVTIHKNSTVPWLDMIKSPALWAIIVVHFANNFGNYTLVTKLPAFMKEVLHFDIKSNGLYSSLPYVASFIVANSASHIIDKLREKHIVTTRNARKIAMLIALVIPAGTLVAVGYVPCDKSYLAVVFLVVAVGINGFNRCGYSTNTQDIAPKFAGEMYGISNTFSTIPGMIAPNLVNAMTPMGLADEWRKVFYVWAAIYVAGAAFYAVFARGEIQSWAEELHDDLPAKESNSESSNKQITEWTLSYVGFICSMILYALRVNMSVAIVCMVKPANISKPQKPIPQECQASVSNSSFAHQEISGEIDWDKDLQGWVLSSFFYGYLITQIPGGYLAGRFGGKRVMLVGMSCYGLVTMLTPLAARYNGSDYTTSAGLVIVLRVLAGLSTGVILPSMQNLFGHWAPPYERSKLSVFCFSGATVGTVVMLGVGGFFCEWESFDGGWPSIFYVGGGACLLFCPIWYFFVFDSPEEHPRISNRERLYIAQGFEGVTIQKNSTVPWLDMLKSPALWAIIVVQFANNFGSYTLVTKLPAFMKEVLHFDIKSNGLYSSLPFVASFIVANSASHIIDKMREKQIVTTRNARKIAMLIALVIPAGALVAVGYIPCTKSYLAVVFLVVAVGFNGFYKCGYSTNAQDIAPKFAGEMFGISNTFGTIPGMIAPNLVNAMTPMGYAEEWRKVFYVWAAIYVAGAAFYAIFARGEIQPWAEELHGDLPAIESNSKSSSKQITKL
ncbi:uncharacterized protein [Watersipora subatra]|uniref:uncharacterized protein n=1 Tax=Watersipora subatra TaxID=2589382 RepID=UPI00355B3B00